MSRFPGFEAGSILPTGTFFSVYNDRLFKV